MGELETARRNLYIIQTGSQNLIAALRKIAEGCENPEEVAKKALANKAPVPKDIPEDF